jgi:hypothetical protein
MQVPALSDFGRPRSPRSVDELPASERARVFTGATRGDGDETSCHHRTKKAILRATAEATNLFLLEDLEDASTTAKLAESDLNALQAVADWIKTFVVKPHKDLGRAGTVCPFVPGSLERKTLWLAPERIAGRDVPEVVELMSGYKRLLLDTRPTDGDDALYNVIVVVFSDLPPDRAQGVFDDVLKDLAVPSYVEDGILFGPYYEGHEGSAIYNSSFRPFQSPVPFLFLRHGVTGDWKFFLDDEEWFKLWARRNGESGVQALAEELRRLPWRTSASLQED